MSIFELPIGNVTGEVLKRLVDEGVKEDLQLEYKETLPGEKSRDKFLTSIAAFANTAGGDVIYGIRGRRDDEGVPTGEPESIVGIEGVNLDQEKLRLEQWIRSCIDPLLVVFIKVINGGADAPCLLVRVPRSSAGLHMVKTLENPFYGRNSAGKYPLAVAEIRAGFLLAESARERLRQFRMERVQRVQSQDAPTNVGPGPKIIFHAFPLSPDQEAWVRFREAQEEAQVVKDGVSLVLKLQLMNRYIQDFHYNIDGFVAKTADQYSSYVQVFRDCGIEVVDVTLIEPRGLDSRDDDLKVIHGINIERGVIRALQGYQSFCSYLGVTGPMVLFLALTGVKGLGIVAKSGHLLRREFVGIDRNSLLTSDVVIDDLSVPADKVLEPLLDFIWNSGGCSRSPHYKDHRWVGDG